MKYSLLIIVILFSLTSCKEKIIFNQKQEISNPWTYQDTIDFRLEVKDTVPAYDIKLQVTHDEGFYFGNVYVLISTLFPNNEIIQNNVSLNLANSKGQWDGKCSGNKCTVELMLSEKIFFKSPGNYTIKINQNSRKENLEGIYALKLILTERK